MARSDKDDTQGFLSRWSQRKRAAEPEDDKPVRDARPEAGKGAAEGEAKAEGAPAAAAAIDPADLPDIDSLEAGSDFSVFMKQGVPEALQRQALRKLWRLNPVFGQLDGLNDYDLDYTNAATVVENLKTIYQVGKGMVLPGEEEAETEKAAEAAEGAESKGTAAAEGASAETAGPAETAALAEGQAEAALPLAEAAPTARSKPRNPGDPVVVGTTTRRSSPARRGGRSALSRRWGDGDA